MVIVLLAICCIGCGTKMSRQEVIAAVKECQDAGLKPVIMYYGMTREYTEVRCEVE